jgi:hypothetical protein
MLYAALILSLIQLSVANWIVWRARHPGTGVVCASLAFGLGPFFLTCLLPAVALQALLLCGAVAVWRGSRRGPRFFLALSIGATLAAYSFAGCMVVESERKYARLRALYPYESMEDRLPLPKVESEGTALSPEASGRLSRVERDVTGERHSYREFQLEMLHEETVSLFVNSPGFGIARMPIVDDWGLADKQGRRPVPSQPGPRLVSEWSPGEWKQPPVADLEPLGRMLDQSILSFADPQSYGYIKDRRHVAGFRPHAFDRVPDPYDRWEVKSLELMGLILHAEPTVYVSDRLPAMSALRGMQTRMPDRFEAFALQVLTRGDDVFVAPVGDGLRMLGAVRSANQCVACHGGGRGDLLGAFSYTLSYAAR